jgi:predicted Zn-dependent protease
MKPSADESGGLSIQPALATPNGAGDLLSGPISALVERDANAAVDDRQVILRLKTLFERDPALLASSLQELDTNQLAVHAATLTAAVREALAARPDSADLHYHAARVAARIGRPHEAADLLERALEINPCHVAASVLLSDVCMVLKQPRRAVAWLQRALAPSVLSSDPPTLTGRNRRGNELFT